MTSDQAGRSTGTPRLFVVSFLAAFVLAGCGGGGSGPSPVAGPQEPAAGTDPVVGEPMVDGNGQGDVDAPAGDGTDEGDPVPDTGTQNPDTGGLDEETPAPDTDLPDPGTGGSLVQSVVLKDRPVPELPGAMLGNIGPVQVSRSSSVAFTGSLLRDGTTEAAVTGLSSSIGLWLGDLGTQQLIARSGGMLPGLPAPIDAIHAFELGENGTIAYSVDYVSEEFSNTAIVFHDAAGSRVLLMSGDELTRAGGTRTVRTPTIAASSAAGVVVRAVDAAVQDDALWLLDGTGSDAPVAIATYREAVPELFAPMLGDGCRLYTRVGFDPQMIADGTVFFDGYYGRQGCGGEQVVARYAAGTHYAVVAEGDPVPGAPGSTFQAVSMVRALPDGSVVIHAMIGTPDGGIDTANQPSMIDTDSLWLFPLQGEPRLFALAGEAYALPPLGDPPSSTFELPGPVNTGLDERVSVSDSGRLIVASGWMIAAGGGHDGQPHPDPAMPGAASLDFIAYQLNASLLHSNTPAATSDTAVIDSPAPSLGIDGAGRASLAYNLGGLFVHAPSTGVQRIVGLREPIDGVYPINGFADLSPTGNLGTHAVTEDGDMVLRVRYSSDSASRLGEAIVRVRRR